MKQWSMIQILVLLLAVAGVASPVQAAQGGQGMLLAAASITQEASETEEEASAFVQANPIVQSPNTLDSGPNFSLQTGLRITEVLFTMLFVGLFFFQVFIWRDESNEHLTKRPMLLDEKRLYISALILFLITGFGHIMSRSLKLNIGASLSDWIVWETGFIIATSTILGVVTWIRPIILLVLLQFTTKNPHENKWMKLILLVAFCVTFAVTSHSLWGGRIGAHSFHLVVSAIWLGGLAGFSVYSFHLKKELQSLYFIYERLSLFSMVALGAVVVVLASGIQLSLAYVATLENLLTSSYGQILMVKLSVIFLLLLIGAVHRYIWLPKLEKATSTDTYTSTLHKLFLFLKVEVVVMFCVILIAGLLSSTSPPQEYKEHNHIVPQDQPLENK